jgi:hypothetical protein
MPEVIRALLAVEEFYDEFGLHSLSSEPLNKWHTLCQCSLSQNSCWASCRRLTVKSDSNFRGESAAPILPK